MIRDLDIYRTATVLIREHGEDAALEAAQRADAMLEEGDLDGQRTWKRVLAAEAESSIGNSTQPSMVWAKDGRRGKAQETQPSEIGRRKLGLIRRIRARGPGRAGLRALPTITGAIQSGLELIRREVDSRCNDRPGFGRGFSFKDLSAKSARLAFSPPNALIFLKVSAASGREIQYPPPSRFNGSSLSS
jgi:hypothetical protein